MAEIVTEFGTFSEEDWGKIVDSGVAAANPWGVPTPDALGSLGNSGSNVDWTSLASTGLKTAGEIVTTVVKGGGQAPPQPSIIGTPKPQINVTLPPTAPPQAGPPLASPPLAAPASTSAVVVGIVGSVAAVGLVVYLVGRKGRR